MDGIPPFVPEVATHDDDRRRHDGDHQEGADGCSDHPRIDPAPDHHRDLFRDRYAIHERVAPDREDNVHEHEIETRVPVPPVPDGQPVEPGEPLQPRDPCEQHDLDQRGVRGEEAGQPREAGEHLAGRVDADDIAAVPPQPHEAGRVSEQKCPEHDPDGQTRGAGARVPRQHRQKRRRARPLV